LHAERKAALVISHDISHARPIGVLAGNGQQVDCGQGANQYGEPQCLKKTITCMLSVIFDGLFLIFATLSLVPLMVMCCCVRKPVRPRLQA
jgi:hypothetical protein